MTSLSGVYGSSSSCARRGSCVSLGVRTRLFDAGDFKTGPPAGLAQCRGCRACTRYTVDNFRVFL
jgi:hypothetical protein